MTVVEKIRQAMWPPRPSRGPRLAVGTVDVTLPDVTDTPFTVTFPLLGASPDDFVEVQPSLPALVVPLASAVMAPDTVSVLARSLAGDVRGHTVRWKYLWHETI